MTEQELDLTLGLVVEPQQNRVRLTPDRIANIQQVIKAFNRAQEQRQLLHSLPYELWLELLPWHSLN